MELASYAVNGPNVSMTFVEVKRRPTKKGKCGCGKIRTRVGDFWQTINPLNVHKRGPSKGQTKTRADILKELDRDVKRWMKEPVTCKNCE